MCARTLLYIIELLEIYLSAIALFLDDRCSFVCWFFVDVCRLVFLRCTIWWENDDGFATLGERFLEGDIDFIAYRYVTYLKTNVARLREEPTLTSKLPSSQTTMYWKPNSQHIILAQLETPKAVRTEVTMETNNFQRNETVSFLIMAVGYYMVNYFH